MFSPMRRGAKLPMMVLALALAAWIVTGRRPLLMGEGAVEAAGMAGWRPWWRRRAWRWRALRRWRALWRGWIPRRGIRRYYNNGYGYYGGFFPGYFFGSGYYGIQAMVTVMALAIPSRTTIRAMLSLSLSTPTTTRFIRRRTSRRGDILASTNKRDATRAARG